MASLRRSLTQIGDELEVAEAHESGEDPVYAQTLRGFLEEHSPRFGELDTLANHTFETSKETVKFYGESPNAKSTEFLGSVASFVLAFAAAANKLAAKRKRESDRLARSKSLHDSLALRAAAAAAASDGKV